MRRCPADLQSLPTCRRWKYATTGEVQHILPMRRLRGVLDKPDRAGCARPVKHLRHVMRVPDIPEERCHVARSGIVPIMALEPRQAWRQVIALCYAAITSVSSVEYYRASDTASGVRGLGQPPPDRHSQQQDRRKHDNRANTCNGDRLWGHARYSDCHFQ